MQEHILVDGYNIIHNWNEFKSIRGNLPQARQTLIRILTRYHDYDGRPLTLVFDGRSLPKSGQAIRTSIKVIYSQNRQSADAVIEQIVGQSPQPSQYLVATDDMAEQSLVESLGGKSISADGFHAMVVDQLQELSLEIDRLNSSQRRFR